MRTGGLFVDMTAAYDPALSLIAVSEVEKCGIVCNRGVIAALAGPSYETPAEIRMLKTLGADAVCMSMVPEVIAARYLGMRVLGMAVITNRAAGLSIDGPNHEEVLKTASIITEGLAGALSKIAGGLGV
jgi:purine-nucleoside phosphorylase